MKKVTNHIHAAWALKVLGMSVLAETYESGKPYWSLYSREGTFISSFTEPDTLVKFCNRQIEEINKTIQSKTDKANASEQTCGASPGPPLQGFSSGLNDRFDPWRKIYVSIPM